MKTTSIARIAAAKLLLGSVAVASAQGLPSTRLLPLSLATEAAMEAVNVCQHNGYAVTATVLDASGLVKAVAKGDGTQPHTLDSSRGKAYSIVTLGPVFGATLNSALADRVLANPKSAQLEHIPGVFLLAGGVLLKAGDDVVGAIGVGGAPGGDKDEACAVAGASKIAGRLVQ
jgi:uncharacterized protein GlcG (DUF336 family)